MKLLFRLTLLSLLLSLIVACGGTTTPPETTSEETEESTTTETEAETVEEESEEMAEGEDGNPVIGLIMKSLGNDFFKNMEEGAVAHAAARGDVELIPLGIQNETDVEAQIALVENLIAQSVDAIVVAPADSRALIPILAQASEAGIVVVNIDVEMDPEAMAEAGIDVPFVGPDNRAGAKMVGDVLAAELGEGAKVIILEGNPGAENAAQRAAGFADAAAEGGLEVVASQTAYWETDEAFELVSNLLTANPDVTGIMASNDSMALGAVQAVEAMGLSDSVTIVGFDNIAPIQPLVIDGTVLATLDQFGAEMAANGMDVAMEMLAGEARTGWIKTPIQLIQAEDLGGEAMEPEANQGEQAVIGLIMKSLGNDFFKNMEEGAVAHAAARGDVELIPLGIQNETDVEAQIALVENLIAQSVDAIVVAPADSRALIPILAQASEAGIVVVNIDVEMDPEAMAEAGIDVPFVGPDNRAGAKMVGDVLAAELGEGAKVIILEGNPGAENAAQRAAGFADAAAEGGLEVVASQTAYWETDEAFELVSNLLTANPDVTGIMASNDSMALGAVQAVESMGLSDSVTIVGFDNIAPIQPLVIDGTVLATLDQFGAEMAANGMDVAMEMLAGETRTGWIKTPIQLIQAEDLQ
ncbi:MAG: sugar ABC transporter substrate-binding protein [Ardenticatenaceae bacterium]|nr:sugar ABC transporter substrate-binding protein [Ardenticatenaceae bacterium]